MIKEHKWSKIYDNADVEQCLDCPVQRRNSGALGTTVWQYRASADDLGPWVTAGGTTAPDCNDAGKSWFKNPSKTGGAGVQDRDRATESLEDELKTLSERIAADPPRFQQVADELRRRREAKDEQPAPVELTEEQRRQNELSSLYESNRLLTLKVTEMEAEQAKLVVEAELHRQQRVDAEEKLALVVRRLPTKREPMTRDAARELANRHFRRASPDPDIGEPDNWVIDAIVEASK